MIFCSLVKRLARRLGDGKKYICHPERSEGSQEKATGILKMVSGDQRGLVNAGKCVGGGADGRSRQ